VAVGVEMLALRTGIEPARPETERFEIEGFQILTL
jgi:hypothetical protein